MPARSTALLLLALAALAAAAAAGARPLVGGVDRGRGGVEVVVLEPGEGVMELPPGGVVTFKAVVYSEEPVVKVTLFLCGEPIPMRPAGPFAGGTLYVANVTLPPVEDVYSWRIVVRTQTTSVSTCSYETHVIPGGGRAPGEPRAHATTPSQATAAAGQAQATGSQGCPGPLGVPTDVVPVGRAGNGAEAGGGCPVALGAGSSGGPGGSPGRLAVASLAAAVAGVAAALLVYSRGSRGSA